MTVNINYSKQFSQDIDVAVTAKNSTRQRPRSKLLIDMTCSSINITSGRVERWHRSRRARTSPAVPGPGCKRRIYSQRTRAGISRQSSGEHRELHLRKYHTCCSNSKTISTSQIDTIRGSQVTGSSADADKPSRRVYRSVKVIKHGTIRYHSYGFLLVCLVS